jgi:transcriptional regulator of heat shock response
MIKKTKEKENVDKISRRFESFLRNSLPNLLNLTPSKQIATNKVFYHFSDFLKINFKNNPEALSSILDEFEMRFKKISKWRAPKGSKISVYFDKNDKVDKYPNGKPRYILVDRINLR